MYIFLIQVTEQNTILYKMNVSFLFQSNLKESLCKNSHSAYFINLFELSAIYPF